MVERQADQRDRSYWSEKSILNLFERARWNKEAYFLKIDGLSLKANHLPIIDFPAKTKGMVYAKISESEVLVCGGSQVSFMLIQNT